MILLLFMQAEVEEVERNSAGSCETASPGAVRHHQYDHMHLDPTGKDGKLRPDAINCMSC